MICEKPLFGSIAEVDEMVGIVAKANGLEADADLPSIAMAPVSVGKLKMLIDLADRRGVPDDDRDLTGGRPRLLRGGCPGAAKWASESAAACSATRSMPMTC